MFAGLPPSSSDLSERKALFRHLLLHTARPWAGARCARAICGEIGGANIENPPLPGEARRFLRRCDEPVPDVANGANDRLVLGAELGAQPPHVYVHSARAAVIVVSPDIAQQLLAAEHPPRVLCQV